MNATRRLSLAALAVACLHLVFGAIVRISGSGMGCGDHWPKCYGYWFPPFNRPDLIVEVSHRYLASILTLTVLSMAFVAWRNRRVPGVGGKGGAMRSAFGAVAAVFSAALLGGLTVKMGNAPWATVAHWLVAMTLLAMVATTAIRSGALGGASSLVQRGTQRARRSGFAAAGLAIFAVALGGLTAKYPGAAVGCTTVPMCGPNPAVETASVHVQITHRTLAVLLVLHLFGVVMMVRKRRSEEAPVVFKAAHIALGMVLLQLVVASSMVLFHLPPVLRSLHEATGVGIWLSCFTLAYLARRASNVTPPEPAHLPDPSPKGGISITREPVAAIASIEAPETRLAVSDARDVSVAQRIVENCVAVAADASPPSEKIIAGAPVASAPIAEASVAAPPVILSEAKDPFVAEEILEIAADERGPSVASLPQDDVLAVDDTVVESAVTVDDTVIASAAAVDDAVVESATAVEEVVVERAAVVESAAAVEEVVAESAAVVESVAAIEEVAVESAAVVDDVVVESAITASTISDDELPPPLAIVAEAEIVEPEPEPEPEPVVILSEAKDPSAAEDIFDFAAIETDQVFAEALQDDVTAEAAIVAELILAMEDAAKEAALESAQARAAEAAIVAEAIAAIAPVAVVEAVEAHAPDVILSEAKDPSPAEKTLDEVNEAAEALDWEPRQTAGEELDEFSIAALEAEVAALEAAQVEEIAAPIVEAETIVEAATVVEPEPIVEAAPVAIEAAPVVAEAPVKAPKLSPITAPTMAVLVARGADFL